MELPRIEPGELRLLGRGDAPALERAYRAFGDRVYRTALHLLGQAADAEDAAQEVFLALPRKVRSYRGEAAFGSWMYRVTVNHCLDRLARRPLERKRQSGVEEALEVVDPIREPSEATSSKEDCVRLRELLLRLPADHRSVLVLRELEGLSYREIADALDVPIGTVMSRLSAARTALAPLNSEESPQAEKGRE